VALTGGALSSNLGPLGILEAPLLLYWSYCLFHSVQLLINCNCYQYHYSTSVLLMWNFKNSMYLSVNAYIACYFLLPFGYWINIYWYWYWLVTCDLRLMTCDLWLVTYDLWLMTCDLWLVTYDLWFMTYDLW
jgi:hypothetical protein